MTIKNKPVPSDMVLYDSVKSGVYKEIPKHSAYRSGIVVQTYKRKYASKYGETKSPYKGSRPVTRKKGLKRWFAEKWVNQRGKIGYQHKNDIYRPSVRITETTPVTHGELDKNEISRARREKYTKGRVYRFRQKQTRKNTRKNTRHNGGNKNTNKSRMKPPMKRGGVYYFKDFPEFCPNLSPREMFRRGSFGGTYWRPITSGVTGKAYKNVHHKYPTSWWKGIDESLLSSPTCDIGRNKYGVRVGTSLEFWEGKNWIKQSHPYGWVHWYCDFFAGKRSPDDMRQIQRWLGLAGPRGRFMRFLVTQIQHKGKHANKVEDYDDASISPKIRQVLQHWGYELTKSDFRTEIARRKRQQ